MTDWKAIDCKGCGRQIGTAPFLLATDGINGRQVAFHAVTCDPRDPDLQRHHKLELDPAKFGLVLLNGT